MGKETDADYESEVGGTNVESGTVSMMGFVKGGTIEIDIGVACITPQLLEFTMASLMCWNIRDLNQPSKQIEANKSKAVGLMFLVGG
ncbi:hypothetical protein Pint_21573 [Pistacia integerrima]|uniref:Uncharacterized protein n=1 Tax=Pistacia integerrima TaxID=434235 RepID=A0ACC0X7X5_9ROSI|nr:hypothetical protein Pint_21573 [Pistacia integerrima]